MEHMGYRSKNQVQKIDSFIPLVLLTKYHWNYCLKCVDSFQFGQWNLIQIFVCYQWQSYQPEFKFTFLSGIKQSLKRRLNYQVMVVLFLLIRELSFRFATSASAYKTSCIINFQPISKVWNCFSPAISSD